MYVQISRFDNSYTYVISIKFATPCLLNALSISPSYESSASHFLSSKQYPSDICRISQPEVWPSVWPNSYSVHFHSWVKRTFLKTVSGQTTGGSLYRWRTANICHGSVRFSRKHYWQLVCIFEPSLTTIRETLSELQATWQASAHKSILQGSFRDIWKGK